MIVSSNASPLLDHVRAAEKHHPPTRPSSGSSGDKGEVDATAPTQSMIHKQEPIGERVMRDFI